MNDKIAVAASRRDRLADMIATMGRVPSYREIADLTGSTPNEICSDLRDLRAIGRIPGSARGKCDDVTGLTPRETDVMTWYAQGKSTQDISQIMGISASMVELHAKSVCARLGVCNRRYAASFLIQIGAIRVPVPRGRS